MEGGHHVAPLVLVQEVELVGPDQHLLLPPVLAAGNAGMKGSICSWQQCKVEKERYLNYEYPYSRTTLKINM